MFPSKNPKDSLAPSWNSAKQLAPTGQVGRVPGPLRSSPRARYPHPPFPSGRTCPPPARRRAPSSPRGLEEAAGRRDVPCAARPPVTPSGRTGRCAPAPGLPRPAAAPAPPPAPGLERIPLSGFSEHLSETSSPPREGARARAHSLPERPGARGEACAGVLSN